MNGRVGSVSGVVAVVVVVVVVVPQSCVGFYGKMWAMECVVSVKANWGVFETKTEEEEGIKNLISKRFTHYPFGKS
ncbi:hypothetical protein E2C01_035587 [Portunus trituberculatus]|uniref:Uncharacterized protein n=1 Tax=Portunus trituberculatus TaxID=210409 RepID=A0A5B7F9K1_PORTR|nr:hypothetical protein [Portunus trituberculatus]